MDTVLLSYIVVLVVIVGFIMLGYLNTQQQKEKIEEVASKLCRNHITHTVDRIWGNTWRVYCLNQRNIIASEYECEVLENTVACRSRGDTLG